MATDRDVTIQPSGSTESGYDAYYNTMNAMELAEDGDLTDAGGTRLIVHIIESDGSWSGSPDTTAVIFDGWKCDKSSGEYIIIQAEGGAKSSTGLYDTTAYILKINDLAIDLDNDAVADNFLEITFTSVQIETTDGGSYTVLVHNVSYPKSIIFSKCYLRHPQIGVSYNFLYDLNKAIDPVIELTNCILEGGDHIVWANRDPEHIYLYNCTLFGSPDEGIETDGRNVTAVNCAVFDVSDAGGDLKDAFVLCNFNASDDVTGDNPVDISPANGTESSKWHEAMTDPDGSPPDVRIKDASSVLYHAGQNQTADARVPSDDITGATRPAEANPVSIGAFEYEAPAGDAMPMAMNIYRQRRV